GKEALFTGVGHGGYAGMLDLATGTVRVEFKEHNNTAPSGHLSPDGKLAISSGGDDNELFIWRLADGKAVHRLAAKGKAVWAAGWSPDGKAIAWGNSNRGDPSPLERTFKLADLTFGPKPTPKYIGAIRAFRAYSLERIRTSNPNDSFYKIVIREKGQARHVWSSDLGGDRIYCFTII